MAASKAAKGKATTTGAKASLEQTWAVVGTSVRIVGGKKAPSARPPVRSLPPMEIASSTPRCARCAWASSTIGPRTVSGSSGSPTRRAAAPARSFGMNASQTSRWMKMRCTLMPTCPVEVGAVVDDDPGVAAQLEHDLLLARALLHAPADGRAAGEGEQLEARVGHHPVAQLAAPGQDADRAGGGARRLPDLGHGGRRQ